MNEREIADAIRNYTPNMKDRKQKQHCPLCGNKLTEIDLMRGKCRCQVLTAEDLSKRMTI